MLRGVPPTHAPCHVSVAIPQLTCANPPHPSIAPKPDADAAAADVASLLPQLPAEAELTPGIQVVVGGGRRGFRKRGRALPTYGVDPVSGKTVVLAKSRYQPTPAVADVARPSAAKRGGKGKGGKKPRGVGGHPAAQSAMVDLGDNDLGDKAPGRSAQRVAALPTPVADGSGRGDSTGASTQ
jgi:hypothetical protein